jgi:outer membrane protein TolC
MSPLVFGPAFLALPLALVGPAQDAPTGPAQQVLFGADRALELTLDAALRIAENNNLRLRIQETSTEAVRFDARARWGAFDWVLGGRARVVDSERPASSQLTGADVLAISTQAGGLSLTRPLTTGGTFSIDFDRVNEETNNTFSLVNPATTDVLALSYTQPLLRNAWRDVATSAQRSERVRFEQELEVLRQTRQQVLNDVVLAYWDLVQQRQQLDVALNALELAREQMERNDRRLAAGVGTEVEVIQSEAQMAVRIEQLLAAEVSVLRADDDLKRLLFPGTEVDLWETEMVPITPLPADEEISTRSLPSWTEAFSVALLNRPELRVQLKAIEALEIVLELAASDRLPQLDLTLGASALGFDGDTGEAFQQAVSFDFPTYSAALVFSYPLGNRAGRYGERAARQRVRAAKLTYDQLESQILADVREALRQVRYQAERVRASVKSLEASSRQLQAEQARFREGLSTNFQVLEFQQDYISALNSERVARVSYARSISALRFAQGVLGEELRRP